MPRIEKQPADIVNINNQKHHEKIEPPEYGYFPNATLKIFFTQDCNLACPGCFNNSKSRVFKKTKHPLSELKPEEVKRIMRESRKEFNTYRVEFSGGEPTLQFDNLLSYIRYGKELGFKTQITTNGSIIGAYGKYKEQLEPHLSENLKKSSPENIVAQLASAGTDNIIVSVDTMHTMHDKDFKTGKNPSPKVPASVVANTLRLFLKNGYSVPRGNDHNILDKYGIRISMTASGSEWKPSFALVQDVMLKAGATLQPERRGRLWVFKTSEGNEITVHRNETADIGSGETLKPESLTALGKTIFERNCYTFHPRSKSGIGGGINQEIAVNYDGEVYTCALQSLNIGNIRENSLPKIVNGVNKGNPPEKYKAGIMMFRELTKIVEETKGTQGWGEAYRRIFEIAKKKSDKKTMEKILSMRSHSGACYSISRDPVYYEYLQLWRSINPEAPSKNPAH